MDKVVIVSGAARGLGFAMAKVLAADGASVVMTDISDGAAASDEIDGKTVFVKHDVTSAADWKRVVDLAVDKFGRLDGVVNNAGIAQPAALLDTEQANFEAHFRVNQLGVYLGMKAAAQVMKEHGGGSIVNISSFGGMSSDPGIFSYIATKWAVRGMTRAAAKELGPFGIRVNAIYPGSIVTELMQQSQDVPAVAEYMRTIPLRRPGQPVEIAEAVKFLISDQSSYTSGAELAITGGFS